MICRVNAQRLPAVGAGLEHLDAGLEQLDAGIDSPTAGDGAGWGDSCRRAGTITPTWWPWVGWGDWCPLGVAGMSGS
jgi:hypothetical protein